MKYLILLLVSFNLFAASSNYDKDFNEAGQKVRTANTCIQGKPYLEDKYGRLLLTGTCEIDIIPVYVECTDGIAYTKNKKGLIIKAKYKGVDYPCE